MKLTMAYTMEDGED